MKTQHTQEKWTMYGNSIVDSNRLINNQNGDTICRLNGADFESDEEMDKAGTKIAASPDLLYACNLINKIEQLAYAISDAEWRSQDRRVDKLSDEIRELKIIVEDAIKKATQ